MVFRGEALCTEMVGPDHAVQPDSSLDELLQFTRFEVLDVYKADVMLGPQIEVRHSPNVICGVEYRRGATPLVLAVREPSDDRLHTGYCMRPRFRESAYRAALARSRT